MPHCLRKRPRMLCGHLQPRRPELLSEGMPERVHRGLPGETLFPSSPLLQVAVASVLGTDETAVMLYVSSKQTHAAAPHAVLCHMDLMMSAVSYMQELPTQVGSQGDFLGPSGAPAPPIPPCTKVPWACPTIHNPYYNYFSKTRCVLQIQRVSLCAAVFPTKLHASS